MTALDRQGDGWPCFEVVYNGTTYTVPYTRVVSSVVEVDEVFYLLTAEWETP